MNVGQINYHDVANGPGIRVAIFVTGCTLACEGCFNAELQDRNAGRPFTLADHAKIIDTLGKPYIAGITLLGGDPMQNTKGLVPLVQDIRKEFGTKKNIWCFSGYTWEEIQHIRSRKQLADMCDILIDGQFKQPLHRHDLLWRGSSNQRIIDIQQTLATGSVKLYRNGNYT